MAPFAGLPPRRTRAAARLFTLMVLVVLAATVLPANLAHAAADYPVPNGHFFTQTGGGQDSGYAVFNDTLDSAGRPVRLWSEFQRLGGVAVLGYPISRVYRDGDGFYYQLFQRAMLQWRPETRAAVLANVLDQLSAAGADPWLASLGVPPPVADDGSRGDFATATSVRLAWLSEPRIKAAYLASGNGDSRQAIARYGLPTSRPLRTGPFVVQRFQRVALQLWLEPVPGMPAPGSVVPLLAGDLYRRHALARGIGSDDDRFRPQAPAPVVPEPGVEDGLRYPLALLAANPEGQAAAAALRTPGVRVVFQEVLGLAEYFPALRTVAVDSEWRDADPRTLAAVLAHEASHLMDHLADKDIYYGAGCLRTEYDAFQLQARVWRAFHGPGGKPAPASELDEELNTILYNVSHNSPSAFADIIAAAYGGRCR